MRIVVVGAGIAGLTLAAALSGGQSRVVLLEQHQDPTPVGSGLQLAPNAARPLLRMGLGGELGEVAVRPRSRDFLRWDDGRLLHGTAMGVEYERRYGAPLYTLLRSDLHRILLRAARDASVLRGRYVTDVLEESDGVTLVCSDGREVHGDIAIGADGVHSVMRGVLNTEQHPPSGQLVYRGLVPATSVPEGFADPRIRIWMGADRHFAAYPVSGGATISFNASVPGGEGRRESWSERGRLSDLTRAFEGWAEDVGTLAGAASWIGVWGIEVREAVRAWHHGRIALMGDAAHPTLPFFAQGANQAVEDAVVLADCLRGATALTAERALARYARLRRERTERIHAVAREVVHEMALDEEGPGRRDELLGGTGGPSSDWLYGYDVAAHLG
ncbi:FAD-dependent monooxygenase [Nocardiopsis mangrovi]|uniref:FAD-dependent monooxygenase n=1 Tax=Nocardiopsis mangrovi TaxID=1179818 RepID=A0ABV9E6E9_9ACTN